MLDLLDIEQGLIVVTKTDLVEPDLLDLAVLEVTERLAGSSLEGAPVVTVSSTTGEGIDELRSSIIDLGGRLGAQEGRPRMWIDRSFSIAGAGTVVTGTLTGGSLRVGEEVALWPGNRTVRIRGLHRHDHEAERVDATSRCAVNVVGLDKTEIERGAMLGRPNEWAASDRWLVHVRTARYEEEELSERGAYHVHAGSGSWPAELRPVETGVAVVRLSEEIPAAVGDRFILREVGRRRVVGGGQILDPRPDRRRARIATSLPLLEGILDARPDEAATRLLEVRGRALADELAAWTGGGHADAVEAGGTMISANVAQQLGERARTHVARFHESHPLRPGIPRSRLASELGIERTILDALLDEWGLRDDGATIAVAGFEPAESDSSWRELARVLEADGLAVPRMRDLDVDPELIHLYLRQGRLVRVSEEFVFLARQIDDIEAAVRDLPMPFTVAQFRDSLDLSRKYAVPLLEFLDAKGVTQRRGDRRTLRG